jgi:hypothetical protein
MRMNYQFNVVRASNGYCLNVRNQDTYDQDTFVFKTWEEVTNWLGYNENYEIEDEKQVRGDGSEAAPEVTS